MIRAYANGRASHSTIFSYTPKRQYNYIDMLTFINFITPQHRMNTGSC